MENKEKIKYVKLIDVEEILSLIEMRDRYYSWSETYEKYDDQVKETIIELKCNAITID